MASQFPYFPSLPLELQTEIWKQTLPPPHVIRVQISTFPTSNLALMTRSISYEEENRLRRSAGFHFTSPYCPPILLHISHHTRQLALSIYRQAFTSGEIEKHSLGMWYQAVNTFRQEWESDAFWEDWEIGEGGDERREFFEKEKEVFDEAKMFLASQPETKRSRVELRVKKGYDKLKKKSPIYKGKWFKRAKGLFEDGKRFAERVKCGQGVWYRPGFDVLFLDRGTMTVLSNVMALLTGKWSIGDVRALAVEEFWEGTVAGVHIFRILFGSRGVGDGEQDEPDSDDEMEDMPPAMFSSLDELTIVLPHAYLTYHDLAQPMIKLECLETEAEIIKEECRLGTLTILQQNSTFTEMPVLKVVMKNDFPIWMENANPGGSKPAWNGCEVAHRKDCYRCGMKPGGDIHSVRRILHLPPTPPPPPPPPGWPVNR